MHRLARHARSAALAIFAGAASIAAGSELPGGDWIFQRETDGVSVYTRPVDDSRYAEVRGTVVLQTPLAAVMGVLDDVEAYPDWIHLCSAAERIGGSGVGDHLIYQVTNLPFPVKDRDMVIRATVDYDASGDVLVTFLAEAAPGKPPNDHYVRINNARGTYLIEPLADGAVRVTWTQFVDPNGPVPGFIVNRMLQETPQQTLANLRKQVAKPRYSQLEFVRDAQGQPIDVTPKSW